MANPPASSGPARPRSSLVKIIAIVFLALIVIVGLTILIIWLSIRPKKLIYTLEDGTINSFYMSQNRLNSSFHFVLRAYNPNKKVSVYYDKVEYSVSYESQTLAYNTSTPFFQPHRDVSHVGMYLTTRDLSLSSGTAKDLKLEKASGDVELDVRMKAKIRFKRGIWKSRRRTMKLLCSPTLVHFSSSKTFQTVPCDVDL